MPPASPTFLCHACGGTASELDAPALHYLVSSDCTPVRGAVRIGVCLACGLLQKEISPAWRELCDVIYKRYSIYHQAAGHEQKARSVEGGELGPRSGLITRYLRATKAVGESGAALDIGCGNGGFLRAMSREFPQWKITGSDLNDSFRVEIEAIKPGASFLSGEELDSNTSAYDLVSLIHSIEHIPDPVLFLARARRFIKPGGLLLIEVPDAEINPFDLIVADHSSHLFKPALAAVVAAAGYDVIACGNHVIGKEITLLARPIHKRPAQKMPAAQGNASTQAQRNLAWLAATLDSARKIADERRPFGIFGTSIAGMWIGSALPGRVDFYVDEDEIRVGRGYLGAPIVKPSDVPKHGTVFVCLEPTLAKVISSRHDATGQSWLLPPPLAS